MDSPVFSKSIAGSEKAAIDLLLDDIKGSDAKSAPKPKYIADITDNNFGKRLLTGSEWYGIKYLQDKD